MAEVFVVPVLDRGLGNQAYLVDMGEGRALAVDPSLDLRALDVEADRRGLWVAVAACGHGERAASAASMLERAGRHDISVLTAGPSDWAETTGRTLDMDA